MKTTKLFSMIGLLAALAAITLSCEGPLAQATASLSIEIGMAGSKGTAVTDLSTLASRVDVRLESGAGLPAKEGSVNLANPGPLTFSGLAPGAWMAIGVAYASDGLEIGRGQASVNVIAGGANAVWLTITCDAAPGSQAGAGSVELVLRWPSELGIDALSAELEGGGALIVDYEGAAGSVYATLSGANIAAGRYNLLLSFYRGGVSMSNAGKVVAALNVWPARKTDKWLGTNGAYEEIWNIGQELLSASTVLEDLELHGALGFEFDPYANDYSGFLMGRDEDFAFTATASIQGQAISFSWNGTAYEPIGSGQVSRSLTMREDNNSLIVRVDSPDRATFREYSMSFDHRLKYYSSSSGIVVAKLPAATWFGRASEAFYSGVREVSQAEYQAVMGFNPSALPQNYVLPVNVVTFYDAIEFCNRLSDLEGLRRVYSYSNMGAVSNFNGGMNIVVMDNITADFSKNGYRLPTEIESMRLRLAGASTRYPWGDDPAMAVDYASLDAASPAACASKRPNAWGVFDAVGNVAEWVWGSASSNVVRPVVLGGSYLASGAAMAIDLQVEPDDRTESIGFRVVRGPITPRSDVIVAGKGLGQVGYGPATYWHNGIRYHVANPDPNLGTLSAESVTAYGRDFYLGVSIWSGYSETVYAGVVMNGEFITTNTSPFTEPGRHTGPGKIFADEAGYILPLGSRNLSGLSQRAERIQNGTVIYLGGMYSTYTRATVAGVISGSSIQSFGVRAGTPAHWMDTNYQQLAAVDGEILDMCPTGGPNAIIVGKLYQDYTSNEIATRYATSNNGSTWTVATTLPCSGGARASAAGLWSGSPIWENGAHIVGYNDYSTMIPQAAYWPPQGGYYDTLKVLGDMAIATDIAFASDGLRYVSGYDVVERSGAQWLPRNAVLWVNDQKFVLERGEPGYQVAAYSVAIVEHEPN